MCSGDHAESCAPVSARSFSRTSMREVAVSAPGSASQSPRRMALRSIAARFSAQRSPARALSALRLWAWMLRTRAGVPAGITATVSPVLTRPAKTVPVTTVP